MARQENWKGKVHNFFESCQNELKRTTEIGKKMLSATKTSTSLKEAYEELGKIAEKDMRKGLLEWNNPRVAELLTLINSCQSDLDNIENEVNKIRFSPVPEYKKTESQTTKTEKEKNPESSNSEDKS